MGYDEFPRVSWEDFYRTFSKRWAQGEHVFINGQTGSGKTDLMLRIMELRKHAVFLVSKPRDPILRSPLTRGYVRQRTFAPSPSTKRILLTARSGDTAMGEVGNQRETFGPALDRIYAQGGWCVGMDETLWLTNRLKLAAPIGDVAYLGRALGLTGVFATQRPAHIPVVIPQQASHAFIGKVGRKSDLKTLSELGGDSAQLERAISTLRNQHDFVYVDTQGQLPIVIVNTQA